MDKRFVSFFIDFLLDYPDGYNYSSINVENNSYHVYTPSSYFLIRRENHRWVVYREDDRNPGRMCRQYVADDLCFALFRCYFRDVAKQKNFKLNINLYESFCEEFNSYYLVRLVQEMEI